MRMHRTWIIVLALLALAIAAPAQGSAPRATVSEFYRWYLSTGEHSRERFPEQRSRFTPALYNALHKAFTATEAVLDFDPFDNAQWPAEAYVVGASQTQGHVAQVPVSITLGRGMHSRLTVRLVQQGGRWLISDFVYPGDRGKSFTLSQTLHP